MAAPLGMVRYAGIPLKIDHVVSWSTRPVYSPDNCDRLYLHHRIAVECWWNPEATGVQGKNGAASIAQLRQQLLRERQRLVITIGGDKILESPGLKPLGTYYKTDARNGPLPIGLNILEITGEKTVKCLFEIETWVGLDCIRSEGRGKESVLSHRWEQSERIDETFLATRTVKGSATFRTDFLIDAENIPDDFRGRLFHPVLPFFQRRNVSVTAKSDGTACEYSFDDIETPGVNLLGGIAGAIAKIRGTWRYGWALPSGGFGLLAELKGATGLYPTFLSVTIQCWGRRTSRRQDLINGCINGVRAFGFDDILSPHAFQNQTLDVDMWDKFAQLNAGIFLDGWTSQLARFASDNIGNAINSVFNAFGNPFGVPLFPGADAEGLISDANNPVFEPISKAEKLLEQNKFPDEIKNLTTTEDVPNPRGPGLKGSRGHSLEMLVAQVLLEQCGTPKKPPGQQTRYGLSFPGDP